MESVAGAAVLVSVGIAGVGVAGLVGFVSPLAAAGSVALIAVTGLTEIAATRLPVHAEARFSEEGIGAKLKGLVVVAGFGALTLWNVTAAHFGAVAIDHAGVADTRAPLERDLTEADADLIAANADLAAFDEATVAQAALWRDAVRSVDPSYVTTGTRRLEAADRAAKARNDERRPLARAAASAEARQRLAATALAGAPTGRDERELWLIAGVLELLKGTLVWFATAGRGRRASQAYPKRDASAQGLLDIGAGLAGLSPAERRALKTQAASILASLRHLEAARA